MDCWHILGIAPTRDEAVIKRAYAQLLKKHRPDRDPDGFIRLREAYETALAGGEQYGSFAHDDDEPAPLLDVRAIRRSWRQARDDDALLALLQAQSELRGMERQLETLQHGDSYNDYERQVINKRRDVARRDSDYRDNINVRRNEEMAKLQKMIGDEIINLAKEARYDIILNDIGVFYVSERADLSPQVITRLQRKAEKP